MQYSINFNIKEATYDKPTTNIILNGKRLKDLILKIKKKATWPLSLLSNIGSFRQSS